MDPSQSGEPQQKLPSCTVVVSTRDRPGDLTRCLESVRQEAYPGLDVVVVDSAPERDSAQAVSLRFETRYLRLAQPGLSRARNAGARQATGEIVIFLDDDVTLEAGCIAALTREFLNSRTAIASGRVRLSGGDDRAREAFLSFGGFDAGDAGRAVDKTDPDWFELVNFGGFGTGALLAVRRSAFDVWAGFDERLGRGAAQDSAEELLAFFSLVNAGYRAVYSPEAIAWHPAPASMGDLRQRVLASASGASAYLTLLLFEYPEHRHRALRYLRQALSGAEREWRPRPASRKYLIVPRWRVRLAWATGPLLYLRMRLRVAVSPKA